MEILNLSTEPEGKLYSWLPHDLEAEKVVFLPDACPGKSPLPTGTAVLTKQGDWRKFAISDCGCGMRLLKSNIRIDDLSQERWDELANVIRSCKGLLGDLGGGNHFLDALQAYTDDYVYFLIHTGSRNESGHVDKFVEKPAAFDAEFKRVLDWAAENRATIKGSIKNIFGKVEEIIDLPHNSYERLNDGYVIIRKGSVYVKPGDLTVIPSHMSGDVLLVKASTKIEDSLFSMSHGTGRKKSRSECKPEAESFDFDGLRKRIMMPTGMLDSSIKTEGPYAYRDLDDCLSLISDYVDIVERYSVVAYMGHL